MVFANLFATVGAHAGANAVASLSLIAQPHDAVSQSGQTITVNSNNLANPTGNIIVVNAIATSTSGGSGSFATGEYSFTTTSTNTITAGTSDSGAPSTLEYAVTVDQIPVGGAQISFELVVTVNSFPETVTIKILPKTNPATTGAADLINDRAGSFFSLGPNMSGFLSGQGPGSNGPPLSFGFAANGNNQSFGFGTSLSQLGYTATQPAELAFDDFTEAAADPADKTGKFDIWTQFHGARTNINTAKSSLLIGYLGGHYYLSSDLLVGALIQVDSFEQKDKSVGSSGDGLGWMIGPYLAGRVPGQDLFYEVRIAGGGSRNDISPTGAYTDSFDTTRFLLSGKLSGAYQIDGWLISPEASLQWFHEVQDAYTDSLATLIPKHTVSEGQLSIGPKFSYDIQLEEGAVMRPSIGLSAVTNFGTNNTVTTGKVRARIDASVSVAHPGQYQFALDAFYDGIGLTKYESYGGSAKVTWAID